MTQPIPSILIKHIDELNQEPERAQPLGKIRTGGDKLDLMPFSIDYHGPAEISKYFLTRPVSTKTISSANSGTPKDGKREETDDEDLECFEGSFRGRYLHGTRLMIPDGYSGLVLSSSDTTRQSSHPSGQPNLTIPPNQSTRKATTSTARGRARGRGRGRGRRLTQAVGTRPPTTRTQLKRKQKDVAGFLDSDDDDDSNDDGQKNEQSQVNKDANERNTDPVVERSVSTDPPHQEPGTDDRPREIKSDRAVLSLQLQDLSSSSTSSLQRTDESNPKMDTIAPPPTNIPVPSLSQKTTQSSKVLKSIGNFDRITIWNVEGKLDLSEDIYARALNEWVGLSNLIHSLPSTTT